MWRLTAIALVGCGRVEFAALGDASPAEADTTVAGGATCPAGALLCDLLDGAALDGSVWDTRGGTFESDFAIKHRGDASLRFTIGPGQPDVEINSYIGHTGTFVLDEPSLWIRAWLRVSALPQATNALEIIGVEQTGASGDGVFLRSNDTEIYHQFDVMQTGAGATVPTDTWFCLVWHLELATTNAGSSQVTSDVLPPFSLPGQTNGAPPVDLLGIGPYFAASNIDVAQPAIDVWFDDVLVDNAPVSCSD